MRRPADILPSEITDPALYAGRRRFIQAAAAGTIAGALGLPALAAPAAARGEKLPGVRPSQWTLDEKPTPYETIVSYGNFYEFGPDKDSPGKNAYRLRPRPWSVLVEGEVKKPQRFDIEDILKWAPLEERTYRMRCVEGWSMVVPWVGFPFSELMKRVEVTGNAKYVEFWSLADPEQMPYVRLPLLDWPYMEGLRLDEAMHPLTIFAVGLYGEVLPKPNGAPLRLVVPWKYGFKGAKSIVRIRFVREMPRTTWMKAGPDEYGFYSNVNPDVPHRRWSQSHERRLGEFLKRKTLPFNGYAEQVAQLYAGMDLRKFF
ncbi:protein-methionine-sulfoxide reductase catalytic subunit MsrP [Azospira restricta]|uniref:Protein-methionine-sulfoxide reductase catalytic subunit MsrP n=1 Tax=Azospira restricta TaxID=404405 RepID=A0A974Y5W4_9RHOO|nr:protein-methionine-sulfoxide reductase catalytic subunit MsrP [Azospira restricta]